MISDPNRHVNMGSPTWSSDGTKIAYATNEGRQPGTLYTINSDGSGLAERHVINAINLITDDAPDWSPDGTKILMGRVIVDLTDGKITGLARNSINASADAYTSWSPDGTQIAVYSRGSYKLPYVATASPDSWEFIPLLAYDEETQRLVPAHPHGVTTTQ